jgi:hypothetical protein
MSADNGKVAMVKGRRDGRKAVWRALGGLHAGDGKVVRVFLNGAQQSGNPVIR